jgi:hypothetical protein
MFANKLNTVVLLTNRVLQWSSAVIVMGITSYFIQRNLKGEHSKYTEVIVCYEQTPYVIHHISKANYSPSGQSTMSVVFFLPAFASIWLSGRLSLLVIAIDTIFSYL